MLPPLHKIALWPTDWDSLCGGGVAASPLFDFYLEALAKSFPLWGGGVLVEESQRTSPPCIWWSPEVL